MERASGSAIVAELAGRCPRCGAGRRAGVDRCETCGVAVASAEAGARLVAEAGFQLELVRGAAYLPRGLWRILTRPKLLAAVALPLALNVFFVAGVTHLVVPPLRSWLSYTTAPEALSDWTGLARPLAWVLALVGVLVRFVPDFAVPALTAWILSTPPFRVTFGAIFGTLISEQVERDALGESSERTPLALLKIRRSLARAVLSSLAITAYEMIAYALLLPIAFVPFVGTFTWLVVPRALFGALDMTDPTLSRKFYSAYEKVALWRLRRWRFLGFGAAFVFLLGTPVLNAVVFPVAAVGAALLYIELDRK